MIEEKARVIYEDYVSILSPREVRYVAFQFIQTYQLGFLKRIMIIQISKSGLFSSNFFVISGESGFSGS